MRKFGSVLIVIGLIALLSVAGLAFYKTVEMVRVLPELDLTRLDPTTQLLAQSPVLGKTILVAFGGMLLIAIGMTLNFIKDLIEEL